MTSDIKAEFGKRFRAARDAKKLSRAAFGVRLGISPKTIQSWEMGRTFIEDLSLIPAIEAELDISVSDLIAKATHGGRSVAAESPAPYGKRKRGYAKAGPVMPELELHAAKSAQLPDPEKLAKAVVAVPLIRPTSVAKNVAELTPRDILEHRVIPGDWVPRGGVLVAYRMSDSGMVPMINLGGTVIVDRRAQEPEKVLNRVVAMYLESKGMRIRRLMKDPGTGRMYGVTAIEGRRGRMPFRPETGDTILGRVIGVLSQPE